LTANHLENDMARRATQAELRKLRDSQEAHLDYMEQAFLDNAAALAKAHGWDQPEAIDVEFREVVAPRVILTGDENYPVATQFDGHTRLLGKSCFKPPRA
jgi:hypothetical protein